MNVEMRWDRIFDMDQNSTPPPTGPKKPTYPIGPKTADNVKLDKNGNAVRIKHPLGQISLPFVEAESEKKEALNYP